MSRPSRKKQPMTPLERRAVAGLAGVYGFRMLGLFLILPVFALFAEDLQGATPFLTGLAIGIYGLTQAILQIPFGLLSDRIGRKPVIIGGLLLFAVGSVIAALAEDIWLIILGRAIQGSGAIAAAVMALAADLTRDTRRTSAMAAIGMTIGLAFAVSLIAGPYLDALVGVHGIFWITMLLSLLGIAIVIWIIPTPASQPLHREAQPVPQSIGRVLKNPQLLRLDFGIFSLHMILTAVFLSVPLLLRDAGLQTTDHALLYLVVLLLAIALMVPFVVIAEKHGKIKPVFNAAIMLIGLALAMLFLYGQSWLMIGFLLLLFFTGFNLLESLLPSLVSKVSPADAKGTAMGIYSSSQFFGGFIGGVSGGLVHHHFGLEWVFVACLAVALIWLLLALGMQAPGQFSNRVIDLDGIPEQHLPDLARRLGSLQGVIEAVVIPAEAVAYLKVDRKQLDEDALEALILQTT